MNNVPGMVDHLFRHEAGKLVAYITRIFGLSRLGLAEDVVQETLIRALETWSIHGIPDNPSAWLTRVARNQAIDRLRRDQQFREFTPELTHLLELQSAEDPEPAAFEREIRDDQLRMMFACCHPELTIEGQITLILKTLCGFSVGEIAHALLASVDAIEKRLGRARRLFRDASVRVDFDDGSIPERLEAVYQAIYLLFNEGYHGSRSEMNVREDLCFEAIRLALLLLEHPDGHQPKTLALLALLCFNAARLPGRLDADGALLQGDTQDRSLWNQPLQAEAFAFLERAASGQDLSAYHLEAAIAAMHAAAPNYEATDWAGILELYTLLYGLNPTPIVGLNRAIALGKAKGPEAGLQALQDIPGAHALKDYPFYPAAQGEFHRLAGRPRDAIRFFKQALAAARSPIEARYFEKKIQSCMS